MYPEVLVYCYVVFFTDDGGGLKGEHHMDLLENVCLFLRKIFDGQTELSQGEKQQNRLARALRRQGH